MACKPRGPAARSRRGLFDSGAERPTTTQALSEEPVALAGPAARELQEGPQAGEPVECRLAPQVALRVASTSARKAEPAACMRVERAACSRHPEACSRHPEADSHRVPLVRHIRRARIVTDKILTVVGVDGQ